MYTIHNTYNNVHSPSTQDNNLCAVSCFFFCDSTRKHEKSNISIQLRFPFQYPSINKWSRQIWNSRQKFQFRNRNILNYMVTKLSISIVNIHQNSLNVPDSIRCDWFRYGIDVFLFLLQCFTALKIILHIIWNSVHHIITLSVVEHSEFWKCKITNLYTIN